MWNDVERLSRGEGQFRVLGAEMARDGRGMWRLVIIGFRKADGESANAAGIGRLHQDDDGRRIDSAGEKGTERNVGDHAPAHGILQQSFQLPDQFDIAAGERTAQALACDRAGVPVALDLRLAAPRQRQYGAGLELMNAFVNPVRRWNVVVAHEATALLSMRGVQPGCARSALSSDPNKKRPPNLAQ